MLASVMDLGSTFWCSSDHIPRHHSLAFFPRLFSPLILLCLFTFSTPRLFAFLFRYPSSALQTGVLGLIFSIHEFDHFLSILRSVHHWELVGAASRIFMLREAPEDRNWV